MSEEEGPPADDDADFLGGLWFSNWTGECKRVNFASSFKMQAEGQVFAHEPILSIPDFNEKAVAECGHPPPNTDPPGEPCM